MAVCQKVVKENPAIGGVFFCNSGKKTVASEEAILLLLRKILGKSWGTLLVIFLLIDFVELEHSIHATFSQT